MEWYVSQGTLSTFLLLHLIYLITYSFHISVSKYFHRVNLFYYSSILFFLLKMERNYHILLKKELIQNILVTGSCNEKIIYFSLDMKQ